MKRSVYLGEKMVFEDEFEDFKGWEGSGYGVLVRECERARGGRCNLKFAEGRGTAWDGGYKLIGQRVGREIVLEGWVYRPASEGDERDSMCILGPSNSTLTGYCFSVSHPAEEPALGSIGIDLLQLGDEEVVRRALVWGPLGSPERGPIALENSRYSWRFYIYADGTLIFELDSEEGRLLDSLIARDARFAGFDRVFVLGTPGYYVDDLKVRTIEAD